MRTSSIAILVISSCITIFVVLYGEDFSRKDWIEKQAGLVLWNISPYIFLFILAMNPQWQQNELKVLLVCTIIICLFGVGTHVDGRFIHLDAQGSLLFIFIPFWQWLGGSLLYVGGYGIYGFFRKD